MERGGGLQEGRGELKKGGGGEGKGGGGEYCNGLSFGEKEGKRKRKEGGY